MNKLLQYMIGAGNISDKYLPHLVKYQSRGEVKKSPLLDMSTPRPVYDNLPDPAAMRQQAMDSVRRDNNAALKAIRQKQGELKPATSQGAVSKVLSVLANPVSAASYVVKGQRIPDYFERGSSNVYDMAGSLVNPFSVVDAASKTPESIRQGDYLGAAMNIADMVPGVVTLPKSARATLNQIDKLSPVGKRLDNIQREGSLSELSDFEIAQRQLEQVGITSNQRQAYIPGVSDFAKKYITPYAYAGLGESKLKQTFKNILRGDKDRYVSPAREDAWRMYLGYPQRHDTFRMATTAPVNHKAYSRKQLEGMDIYSLNNEAAIGDHVMDQVTNYRTGKALNNLKASSFVEVDPVDVMGNFNARFTNDGLQYNDIWDLEPSISLKHFLPRKVQDLVDENPLFYKKSYQPGAQKPSYSPRRLSVNVSKFFGKPFMSHSNLETVTGKKYKEDLLNTLKDRVYFYSQDVDVNNVSRHSSKIDELQDRIAELNNMKKFKNGGVFVSSRGQWDYPGQDTLVPTPTGQITMQGVPYPVYGQDETGYGQMMMPGGEYQFPGQMVYERPMMQKGGPAPIFVSDPKDSRLKNYEDSLYNYNLGRQMAAVLDADKNLFKVHPGSDYDKALQAKVKGAGNKFIDNSEIDAGGYKNYEKIGSIMKEYQRKGNKAILPIRYQGYFPDPDNSVVDMVTLRSVWDALGVTDPRPPGAANLPQWKKPERQVVYKPADPVPAPSRKTSKKPSGANTLFVNNPNDPRLKAYQDSLRVSSKHSDLDSPSFVPGNSDWVDFVRRANNIPADQKIDPIGIHADSDGIPVYKYPRRPVVYKKDPPQLATVEQRRAGNSMGQPVLPQLSPNAFSQNNMTKSRAVDFWNPSMPGGVQGGWHRRLFGSMEEADNFMKFIRENNLSQGYEVTNSGVNNDADRVSYDYGGSFIPKAQFGIPSFPASVPLTSMAAKLYNKFMTPSPKAQAPTVMKTVEPQDNLTQLYDMQNEAVGKFESRFNVNDRLPSDSSQMLNLSSGRFRGAKVTSSLIKDIVASAKEQDVDPWVLLSVVGRESTYGSGTRDNRERAGSKKDLVSGWTVAEDYRGYDPERFLADRQVPGVRTIKDYHRWRYEVDDEDAVQNYLAKNPKILEQYKKKLSSLPDVGDMDAFDLAARKIKKKGLKNYNPGDPTYEKMVYDDMKLLKSDKEMAAMMKSLGYKNGGEHGGLDRWFAEKWVDIKTGKECGRDEGEKRKGYPACRPSRRVNEDTPKTASELSSSERERFKRSKTSSERINYQHQKKTRRW